MEIETPPLSASKGQSSSTDFGPNTSTGSSTDESRSSENSSYFGTTNSNSNGPEIVVENNYWTSSSSKFKNFNSFSTSDGPYNVNSKGLNNVADNIDQTVAGPPMNDDNVTSFHQTSVTSNLSASSSSSDCSMTGSKGSHHKSNNHKGHRNKNHHNNHHNYHNNHHQNHYGYNSNQYYNSNNHYYGPGSGSYHKNNHSSSKSHHHSHSNSWWGGGWGSNSSSSNGSSHSGYNGGGNNSYYKGNNSKNYNRGGSGQISTTNLSTRKSDNYASNKNGNSNNNTGPGHSNGTIVNQNVNNLAMANSVANNNNGKNLSTLDDRNINNQINSDNINDTNSAAATVTDTDSNLNDITTSTQNPTNFKDDLCMYAWDVLRANLESKAYPEFPNCYDKSLECPLFVTWSKDDVLRGCIGCLEPLKLSTGLKDYTLKSALHDSRFPPISYQELTSGRLTCQVSVLHTFEKAKNCYDWILGTHGILLNFGAKYSSTYLPEVPPDAGFTVQSSIKELAKKAGYHRSFRNPDVELANVSLTRYQSTRVKISGEEYERRRGGW